MRQLKLVITIIFVSLITSCNTTKKENKKAKELTTEINDVKFTYQNITGVGVDSVYNRRDNSDIIKVNDTYYMWYTRMNSPTTSGYWGTIWYATSQDDGYTWKEQGMALGLGKEDAFDSHAVFTPNILVYNNKYYLYYTGVKPTPGNKNKEFENNSETDITAIGLAVSDSPDGPFVRVENNPILEISTVDSDFDSFRIDDASLLVRDEKIWLFYKGRSLVDGKKGPGRTKMSVAYADKPDGYFKKHKGYLLDKSHEVLIWNKKRGIASLASLNKTLNFSADGEHFSVLQDSLKKIPKAPGLYRPHLENGNLTTEIPGWGISMIQKKGLAYLVRFEMK
ncbi:family 43 glycosylhydrolase [Lutibacter sp. A80]|uniref:family 43 glycosylhydrolase n=1 Tax=Lutibacter sp. A80 TaxID=2918453 RepID=UPI001F06D8E5|nr:family 43 glycosylhydrolase [Lutibacter sp. A80]UMB59187.1 family 43 glycosylhydrolase [Lutibacter sp. A80]